MYLDPRAGLRSWLMLITAALTAVYPCCSGAGGFALLEQSASRLGTAFAGTGAAADDASTIYFNPAGLLRLDRPQVSLVTSGIEITSEFNDSASAAAFGQPLGGNGGDAGAWNFVPSAYLAAPINERWAVGIGVNAPFGLATDYDAGWMGRFHALRSEIETLNVNPSLAYALSDRLAFGVGIDYQRLQAELTNAVDYSAVIAQGVQQLIGSGQLPPGAASAVLSATAGLEGRAAVRGDDAAWGYNIGLLYDWSDDTRLALAYRSKLDYDVRGTVRFTTPVTTNPIGTASIAQASAPEAMLSNGAVAVAITLPDSAVLSLQQALGRRAQLLLDVAWTGWSTVQELRVVRDSGATVSVTPERWHDTWRYALGASYAVSERFTLRAGVAYDATPVPTATRTPRLPDADRTWLAIGARWRRNSLILDCGFAHLFAATVHLAQDGGNAAAAGVLVGRQRAAVNIVSTQLAYRF
jgi:long-chain fatty acid transport protein